MSTHRIRYATIALATALAVGGTGTAAQAAASTGGTTPSAVTQTVASENPAPATVERADDGTVLVRLSGAVRSTDSIVVDGSLLGELVVVPGDSGRSTIRVRNEGPTSGTLTASIVNAVAHRNPTDPAWIDDSFYDDLTINGIPAAELEGGTTVVHEAELARGATVDVPVSFEFPVEATSGNHALVGERVFSFDVSLRIVGDTPGGGDGGQGDGGQGGAGQGGGTAQGDGSGGAADADTGSGSGTDTGTGTDESTDQTDDSAATADGSGIVADTGGDAFSDGRTWLLLVAAALTALAGVSARMLRRRARPATVEVHR